MFDNLQQYSIPVNKEKKKPVANRKKTWVLKFYFKINKIKLYDQNH